jgi:hypothetical protein
MACALIATAGADNANSYATIAAGDTYFESHPYPDTWDSAGEDEKCRALARATKMLDEWFEWYGDVASSDQALLWPRDGVYGPNGYEEASDAIPTRIEEATIELASALLASDRTADSETESLKALTAGPVSIQFRSTTAKPIPDAVMVKVSVYGTKRSSTGGAVHLYRG